MKNGNVLEKTFWSVWVPGRFRSLVKWIREERSQWQHGVLYGFQHYRMWYVRDTFPTQTHGEGGPNKLRWHPIGCWSREECPVQLPNWVYLIVDDHVIRARWWGPLFEAHTGKEENRFHELQIFFYSPDRVELVEEVV